MLNFIKYVFSISVFFISCAEWETKTDIISTGVINTERTILIEDFTGASCPNCPVGVAELERIHDKYPDNIIILGIHSRFLAEPVIPTDPNLVTIDANNIEKFLGAYQGKPEAAINRRFYAAPNIRILKPDTWLNFVEQELNRETEARLIIEKNFDESNRELSIKLTTTALIDLNFPIHVHVAIAESGIHTAQKNTNGIIDDYEQNHVLRKLLTPVGGDLLIASLGKNNSEVKEYKFTLPAETPKLWKADNCSIVAFVSRNDLDKVVLQANELKIK